MAQSDSQPGQSFAQLLMIERPSLVRLARRILGDSSLAEDIAQTLWLRVQRIADPAAIKDKRAYLYRLALNLTSDQMRRRKRGAVLFEGQIEDPGVIDAAPTTEARIIHRQRLDLLAEAIDELPPRCREVFLLRRIEELSPAEVAERLGITPNAVAKHVRHALHHCQTRLAEREAG
ncbi:MAG: sigma-70 family RNA polymerase sigma factor [Brevundimonas sp.]|uniref:RNA polymerase sigma factor n=1 Tax=Brevundimonas sp. TaxID=1871086 RepID=UPI002564EC90|nr:sigma-70 family RNA polymerase sigma factor [Brevundimonas sp.]MDK2745892.1 sigma-70 family RNA polymerase sigma factor [Brevundimonas sp.]